MPRAPKPRRRTQKATGGLKGFAEARKNKIDLLRDIQTHVVADSAKHGNDHRSKDKIHVSEIVKDGCPRMLFYKVSGEETTDIVPGAWHQLVSIWAAGTAEHEKWQRWIQEMGDLWGTWICLVCEHSFEALSPPQCEECGSGLLRYDEVNLEHEEFDLIGHADGAIPRLNTLVEIKSFSAGSVRVEDPGRVIEHTHKVDGLTLIDHDGMWKSLKRPLKSHIIQGLFYLLMCQVMGLPYDRIIFIYESKTTQATKSFEIKLTDRMLQPYIDTLTLVQESKETGVAPPRPNLYVKDAKPCKECPFKTKCWETDDDVSSKGTAVPSRRPRPRSEAPDREAAVQPSRPTRRTDATDPGGHHRTRGPRTRQLDDGPDPVGRASRRAVGDGRGGRTVGRRSDGEVQGPRFARRNREGRDQD